MFAEALTDTHTHTQDVANFLPAKQPKDEFSHQKTFKPLPMVRDFKKSCPVSLHEVSDSFFVFPSEQVQNKIFSRKRFEGQH